MIARCKIRDISKRYDQMEEKEAKTIIGDMIQVEKSDLKNVSDDVVRILGAVLQTIKESDCPDAQWEPSED